MRIASGISFAALAVLASCFLPGLAAEAVTVRYVASNGAADAPCTRLAPCRTLRRAIKQTPAGGEVQILDSGNYDSAVTIGKSITISAVGVTARVGGFIIDAAGASVVLRGLSLNGASGPDYGIDVRNVAALHVVGCTVERFVNDGIFVQSSSARVFVSDSTVRYNGSHGLNVHPDRTDIHLTVDRSSALGNGGFGILVQGASNRTVMNRSTLSFNATGFGINHGRAAVNATVAANNGGPGFLVNHSGRLALATSKAHHNSDGLQVTGLALARVSESVFTHNGSGLRVQSGLISSRDNNIVIDNGTDVSGLVQFIGGT